MRLIDLDNCFLFVRVAPLNVIVINLALFEKLNKKNTVIYSIFIFLLDIFTILLR